MKKSNRRRGSALILAIVIALICAGLTGAFMAMTARTSKTQFFQNESDEAQQICDAGLEMARGALLKWRNQDNDIRPPAAAIDPKNYAWNKVFLYCSTFDTTSPGMGASADPDVIKADALARFKNLNQAVAWSTISDGTYNWDKSNIAGSIGDIGTGTTIGTGVADLFCRNRRYGKGAFHIAIKNNVGDIHGDGVDNGPPFSGNSWRFDPAIAGLYAGDPIGGAYNSGSYDPMIDGDGQCILVVTATLPDGTQHQIEALVAYPFPGSSNGGAINANGDITMNGSFSVQGTLGSVNANGNISGNGSANALVSVSVNATGSNGLTMSNRPPAGINSGTTPIPINPVDVTAFLSDPKYKPLQDNMYVFHSDGTVTKNGATVSMSDFSLSKGSWSLSGKATPPNAVYYFEGDFKMTGQGNATAYSMTIIATGSVELGGNAKFQPSNYLDPVTGMPTGASTGQLVVAGQDLSLHGTGQGGGVQYEGSNFANEQVEIRGNFTMNGSITAADATDTAGSAVSSSNNVGPDLTIGGNPTIIDNGTSSIIQMTADHLDLKGLRRVR
jgi:hypothetical protein